MRDKIIPIILGLTLTAIAVFCAATSSPEVRKIVDGLNYLIYDVHLRAHFHDFALPTPIVIIDIDEKSLSVEGKWPWPRDKVALLIKKLKEQGTKVIAFDMIFRYPDKNYAKEVLDKFEKVVPGEKNARQKILLANLLSNFFPYFENDKILADAIKNSTTVLGLFFHDNPEIPNGGQLPAPILTIPPDITKPLEIPSAERYFANLPELQQASSWGGFMTLTPDSNGVLRRSPLLLRYEDKIYPSLALAATRLYLLADKIQLDIAHAGQTIAIRNIHLGDVIIPTDAQGRMIIPYRGPAKSFPYYSAIDILEDRLKPGTLKGSLAFVGTTALRLIDNYPIPLQYRKNRTPFPSVEAQANIAAAILNQKFLYNFVWGKGLEIGLLILIGIAGSIALPFLSSLSTLLMGTLSVLLLLIVKPYLFVAYGLVLPEILSLALTTSLAILNLAYGYIAENRRRNELKAMFGRYVPVSHVEEMLKTHGYFSLEGESKEMTVLFADIRNFTSLSESLDATGVKKFLNLVFTPMTKIIFDYHGTVDKYMGDMIMAFWGAPLADNTHAQHALQAAFAMLEELKKLQPELTKMGLPTVKLGIGLNTGIMNVGDMGSEYRRAYTVLGDEVNLASRLEASTKFYHTNLIVSESVMHYNPDYLYRQLDVVKVKGKQQAIRIYQPLCKIEEATPEQKQELENYKHALEFYFAKEWQAAKDLFSTLSTAYPNIHVYRIYLERVNALILNPPGEGWDGSFTRTEK